MITKILQKYAGIRNCWYPNVQDKTLYINPEIKEEYSKGCYEKEQELVLKWKQYIPHRWYGFSLGEPCPYEWYGIINDFLEYFIGLQTQKRISNFEIYQIKIKFGGLRFYVGYDCDNEELQELIFLQINYLEYQLFDEKLIY